MPANPPTPASPQPAPRVGDDGVPRATVARSLAPGDETKDGGSE